MTLLLPPSSLFCCRQCCRRIVRPLFGKFRPNHSSENDLEVTVEFSVKIRVRIHVLKFISGFQISCDKKSPLYCIRLNEIILQKRGNTKILIENANGPLFIFQSISLRIIRRLEGICLEANWKPTGAFLGMPD
jgi:hypothetical protein